MHFLILGMARILFVIAPKDFRDEEYFQPRDVFLAHGHQVATASLSRSTCKGVMGGEVIPNTTIFEAKPELYNVLVIAGGPGTPRLAESPEMLRLVQGFANMGKIVAAICIAPTILARAEVLRGRKATVWSSFSDKKGIEIIKSFGAIYTPASIVEDKNIITAHGPEVAREFGERIVSHLSR